MPPRIATPRKYRVGRARAVAEPAARLTKRFFARRGLADGAVVRDWPTIAGAWLAERSRPLRITQTPHQRRGGTLVLQVADGGAAMEIQHLENLIRERVNAYFGYPAVARLKLVQAPLPKRPDLPAVRAVDADPAGPAPDLPAVADPDLRDVLESLGRSVARRRAVATKRNH